MDGELRFPLFIKNRSLDNHLPPKRFLGQGVIWNIYHNVEFMYLWIYHFNEYRPGFTYLRDSLTLLGSTASIIFNRYGI